MKSRIVRPPLEYFFKTYKTLFCIICSTLKWNFELTANLFITWVRWSGPCHSSVEINYVEFSILPTFMARSSRNLFRFHNFVCLARVRTEKCESLCEVLQKQPLRTFADVVIYRLILCVGVLELPFKGWYSFMCEKLKQNSSSGLTWLRSKKWIVDLRKILDFRWLIILFFPLMMDDTYSHLSCKIIGESVLLAWL